MYLLQLVQALRYEPEDTSDTTPVTELTEPSAILSQSGQPLSLLAAFLIQRACASPTVANFFYWYLKVETEDELTGAMFQNVFDTFIVSLSMHSPACKLVATQLRALDDYMKQIARCQGVAREVGLFVCLLSDNIHAELHDLILYIVFPFLFSGERS